MSKKCEIVNGQFSWFLRVDGQDISFQGGSNADYFEKHYKELGYEVTIIDEHDLEVEKLREKHSGKGELRFPNTPEPLDASEIYDELDDVESYGYDGEY